MRKIPSNAWSKHGRAAGISFNSKFVAAGDSITENGGALSAGAADLYGRGYWVWANELARARLQPAYQVNAGITGNTSTQLLTRYPTDVIAKLPKVVFLLIGTNDPGGGISAAQTLINIDAMIKANRNIDATTILGKILPRGSIGSPMSAPQIAHWEAVNAGIAVRAAADVRVWDAESAIGNVDANHTMKTGHSTGGDFLHPNTLGAYVVGGVVAPVINALVTAGDGLFIDNNAALNFISNGFLTGNGGSKAGGATGNVADGWTGDASLGLGAAMACDTILRANGFGEWQQFAITGTYNGTSGSLTAYRQGISISIPSATRVQLECEIEVDLTTAKLSAMSMIAQINGGAYAISANGPTSGEVAGPSTSHTAVIRSQQFQLPAPATTMDIYLRATLVDVGGATAVNDTVRFGRVGLRAAA